MNRDGMDEKVFGWLGEMDIDREREMSEVMSKSAGSVIVKPGMIIRWGVILVVLVWHV